MSFESSRSTNSAASSDASRKRGRPTANPWSSSGARNPRKEDTNKTPAAPSGSNRPASSKSSSRTSPFPDFGSYMVVKNQKLRDQFDADASTSSLGSGGRSHDSGTSGGKGIFRGVSIFVDGYTVPSSQELRTYMLKHGGRFENYFSRQTVTHIVCSHLPDSKMKNLRSFSRGLPVVKPTWILDSVAANKLLNWVPYQLDELVEGGSKQPKLSAFFTLKNSPRFNDAEPAMDTRRHIEAEGTLLDDNGCEFERVGESSKCESEGSEESDDLGQQSFCEVKDAELNYTNLGDGSSVVESHPVGLQGQTSSNPHHSTLGDPNFVENYFKSSRLHFIGTWRNRYRKRFLNSARWNKRSAISLPSSGKSVIIHVDMDCFFVSVVTRNYPELFDKPVAVCHSDSSRGTAEISSANYPARAHGVRAGLFVRDAKALCPQLVIFPYNFEAYEEVADQFYTILHEHCPKVQAISCDEAFLDVTDLADDAEKLASGIRQLVSETTGCTASAGIAGNMLLARLATRSAKPNGQFYIWPDKVDDYLRELPIKALPGIGYALEEKLKNRHMETCGQLRLVPKESLHKDFGKKTGDMLWNYCRGIDNRMVDTLQEMKSVGTEVNWGIRFSDMDECHRFLTNLCKEVSSRLKEAEVKGRTIMLKVRKRKEGADEPTKYMGCGECESVSRSMTVSAATDSVDMLTKISKQLFDSFHFDAKEIRGIGLQLSKLEVLNMGKQGNTLESWLASASETSRVPQERVSCQVSDGDNAVKTIKSNMSLPEEECKSKHADFASFHPHETVGKTDRSGSSCFNLSGATSWKNQASILPPMSHLDINVIKCLPLEIISEINEMYNGKLSDLIEKYEDKNGWRNDIVPTMSHQEIKEASLSAVYRRVSSDGILGEIKEHVDLSHSYSVAVDKGKQPVCSSDVSPYEVPNESMVKHWTGSLNLYASTSRAADTTDLMPTSLSQVDESILQQLPEELKVDLCQLLSSHRNSEHGDVPSASFLIEVSHQGGSKSPENYIPHLWEGNPPKWVFKFKTSSCLMLNMLAEGYPGSVRGTPLSSTLQSLIPLASSSVSSDEGWDDEALYSGCEFLTQYIKLKVESDIEELYLCFLILKRLTKHSKFFSCVYNAVLPCLQSGCPSTLFAYPYSRRFKGLLDIVHSNRLKNLLNIYSISEKHVGILKFPFAE